MSTTAQSLPTPPPPARLDLDRFRGLKLLRVLMWIGLILTPLHALGNGTTEPSPLALGLALIYSGLLYGLIQMLNKRDPRFLVWGAWFMGVKASFEALTAFIPPIDAKAFMFCGLSIISMLYLLNVRKDMRAESDYTK